MKTIVCAHEAYKVLFDNTYVTGTDTLLQWLEATGQSISNGSFIVPTLEDGISYKMYCSEDEENIYLTRGEMIF